MTDFPRLIEHAFPLKQASLDSVHEKNVRHGHISTLHIWPARRPLAACRAALIATLLPDPSAEPKPDGMSEEQWQAECARRRQELCEKIGGKVVKKVERKKMPNGAIVEREKLETEGGILHWGRETENAADLEWFRQEIRKAYGGRAPKVLDPFAGGGAIPLEAMRLGCEATAIDINPVAWFILKCTLEYPQKLAGQTRPLPEFILHNDEFMRAFFTKAKGYGKVQTTAAMKRLAGRIKKKNVKHRAEDAQGALAFMDGDDDELNADLAWHVRAWGQWVLDRARRDLARYYPVYADFEPIKADKIAYERQPMKLVPLKEDGTPDIDALNADFSKDYLEDKRNPRWVAKPTVAYLWARTVTCKNCRATVPLLKTRWLCKKDRKRILLTMEPNAARTSAIFGVEVNVPLKGGNAAQKREHDKRIGAGTMSQSGVCCPCCATIVTMQDIQIEATQGRWGSEHLCTVVDGQYGKEYRCREEAEDAAYRDAARAAGGIGLPLGEMNEPIDPARPSPNARGMSGLTRYGLTSFRSVYNERQYVSLASFTVITAQLSDHLAAHYMKPWGEAIQAELALAIDRVADRNSSLCHWDKGYEKIAGTFQRYALRVNWDYCEVNPFAETTGNYGSAVQWIAGVLDYTGRHLQEAPNPGILHQSVTTLAKNKDVTYDVVLTDPPYYDAIPYADVSDFFYVWLRRAVANVFPEDFASSLTPKVDELIQHSGRMGGDNRKAKEFYELGMASAFAVAAEQLADQGRFVVVFAHKQPDAWETLVSAIIRAGFVVDGSWPIQTEMPNKAAGGARLASSVWLVCRKRAVTARSGWDNNVLQDMRTNIGRKLRDFWDAGIRGPDFVWAATGPALEAYSKHPVVKKANDPGQVMTVSEFLNHVRRIVVDYVVGQVLSGGHASDADVAAADRLDEPTAYYLLHRNDFGAGEAPVGTCILYAVSCGLSDQELAGTWDLLSKTGSDAEARRRGGAADEEEDTEAQGEGDAEVEEESGSGGSTVKLKPWYQRKGRFMGLEAPGGRPVPLIDRIHRLMHLWRGGDVHKVDEYLDENGLRRQELFKRVLQSLIELARDQKQTEELQLLERLSNHIGIRGMRADADQQLLADESGKWTAEE